MSDFETPIMRDVTKLMSYLAIGMIIGLFFVFSFHAMMFDIRALLDGYSWFDRTDGGCYFQYDESGTMKRSVCGSGWVISPLMILLLIGLILVNVWLYRKLQNNKRSEKE